MMNLMKGALYLAFWLALFILLFWLLGHPSGPHCGSGPQWC